jgi:hypothetical protein
MLFRLQFKTENNSFTDCKNKHMKLFTVLSMCFFTSSLFANDWQVYLANEKVKIFYKYADCHDEANGLHQEKVLFKYENLTDKNLSLNFNRVPVYSKSSRPADVFNYTLQLAAKQSVSADCATKDKSLIAFSKHLEKPDARQLQSFTLSIVSLLEVE